MDHSRTWRAHRRPAVLSRALVRRPRSGASKARTNFGSSASNWSWISANLARSWSLNTTHLQWSLVDGFAARSSPLALHAPGDSEAHEPPGARSRRWSRLQARPATARRRPGTQADGDVPLHLSAPLPNRELAAPVRRRL